MKMDLPLADLFAAPRAYFDSAARHPISNAASLAIARYANGLAVMDPSALQIADRRKVVRTAFAALINASDEEIAFVPSTLFAENLILAALGIGERSGGGVVTDRLHFFGSLALYASLAERGVSVTIVEPIDGRIEPEAIAAAIRPDTQLVVLSLVSATTGFAHDLTRVCELAHARGVRVYADIVQAAGACPIDVRASGVDFCACATYKWLMGDMGLGFLYVRGDRRLELRQTVFGPGSLPQTMPGFPIARTFEVGTLGHSAIAALSVSLPMLLETGIERIEAYRQPLIARIRTAFTERGNACLTPPETRGPILAFTVDPADRDLRFAFASRRIRATWRDDYVRIAVSLFNTAADIDWIADAISGG